MDRLDLRRRLTTVALALALVAVSAVLVADRSDDPALTAVAAPTSSAPPATRPAPSTTGAPPPPPTTTAPTTTAPPTAAAAWTTAPYEGLGAWIDVFDYDPAYAQGGGPQVGPEVIDLLVSHGVRTLYLQAGRDDERTPGGIVAADLMGPLLVRAHERGLSVVAWYLPLFRDVEHDLGVLRRMASFEHSGHRFDGVAVDIEANQTERDHAVRSQRLVELSQRFRAEVPGAAIGAIVVPPVLLEVINPGFWPGFPWAEISTAYDVWMPMSYWTFRTTASGYRDPHRYSVENVRRLVANVGRPVPVHLIGGVGDRTTDADFAPFVQAAVDVGAVGASFYDVRTTTAAGWAELSRLAGLRAPAPS